MKITEALLAEHQVFHNLFDYIESSLQTSKSLGEIKLLAAVMETMLAAHSRTEDDLFIGPLEHCFEQIGHRETFHLEHDAIDGNLKLIQKAKHSRPAHQLLLSAVATSRKNFDRVKLFDFPMPDRTLMP